MRLGQKIAALHKKNHLFQEALAEKMNVSRQAVSNRCAPFFVKSNIIMDSYNILLQTDDYTAKKKLEDYEQIRHTLLVNSSLTI